jgi:hypothetical protein
MSKKMVYILVLVGLALTLTACGGNGVSCPDGYTLQGKTQNNPDGFCKSADGQIAPVVKTSTPSMDLRRDWKNTDNPLQKIECGLTNADICK